MDSPCLGNLVGIKIGGKELIEKGAASLKRLADKIDAGKTKAPAFSMVLTAVGDFAYRRDDGVFVIPIAALAQGINAASYNPDVRPDIHHGLPARAFLPSFVPL